MLSYELCKKLKEAGFSQDIDNGDYIYGWDGEEMCEERYDEYWSEVILSESIRIPTLSELIEACGDRFFLQKESNSWRAEIAGDNAHGEGDKISYGSTPEEVVAELYLAFNEKES